MTFVVTRQRAQEVHDRARARNRLPYAYGGSFTDDPKRSTDCSGLVLQTAAWYKGRTDWQGNRYGSTESFRLNHKIVLDLGFKRVPAGGVGSLPIKPVMLVGLQHGGGGRYSHTACTLMTMNKPGGPVEMSARGVDWESRGGNPGVFLYDGARAWNDKLFHDFWYLDAVLEGGTAPTTSEATLTDTGLYASASPYRTDDKRTMSETEMIRQTNGMVHARLIEEAALQGFTPAAAMVLKLAQGQGPGASDKFKVEHAKHIIRTIQSNIAGA